MSGLPKNWKFAEYFVPVVETERLNVPDAEKFPEYINLKAFSPIAYNEMGGLLARVFKPKVVLLFGFIVRIS